MILASFAFVLPSSFIRNFLTIAAAVAVFLFSILGTADATF